MSPAVPVRPARAPSHCRWVDIVGRNPAQLERVRRRLAFPRRLVALSLSEYLYPAVLPVEPGWFLITYFTIPAEWSVFALQPVMLWIGQYAIVTVSPWAGRQSVLNGMRTLHTTRDGLICQVLEAAVASHEEVGQKLNEAFFGRGGGSNPHLWHRKELRVVRFVQLLDHQLMLVRAVGMRDQRVRQVREQLQGLLEIARYAARQLRESGYCRICQRTEFLGQRKGH